MTMYERGAAHHGAKTQDVTMSISHKQSAILISVATTTLAGCGDIGSQFTAIPVAPPQDPEWAQPLALSGSQEVAVLVREGSEADVTMSFDAERGLYLIAYDGKEGGIRLLYDDENALRAQVADPDTGVPDKATSVIFFHGGDTAPSYSVRGSASDLDVYSEFLVFIPTPAAEIPITGTATYDVAGYNGSSSVEGELAFDFAAGTLGGFLDAEVAYDFGYYDAVGHFELFDSVYRVGSTSFSSLLVNAEDPELGGSIYGLFAGPGAIELAGQYSFDVRDGALIQTMTGLFWGQKQ